MWRGSNATCQRCLLRVSLRAPPLLRPSGIMLARMLTIAEAAVRLRSLWRQRGRTTNVPGGLCPPLPRSGRPRSEFAYAVALPGRKPACRHQTLPARPVHVQPQRRVHRPRPRPLWRMVRLRDPDAAAVREARRYDRRRRRQYRHPHGGLRQHGRPRREGARLRAAAALVPDAQRQRRPQRPRQRVLPSAGGRRFVRRDFLADAAAGRDLLQFRLGVARNRPTGRARRCR